MFNGSGECGLGAVVPWPERLWVVTYAPHKPHGSDDKLYEIDRQLNLHVRPESVGGTPANRMIHRESQQLIIGPYFIDRQRTVRVVSPKTMPGRPTATARHLDDPTSKVYFFTMEEGLYEVDVKTLDVTVLNLDGNARTPVDIAGPLLPGYHGKGAYTSQRRLVVSNNGELRGGRPDYSGPSGCLAEWDGTAWNVVDRNQFVEVTGPGGISASGAPDDPIWATGWDRRSVVLKMLDGGRWHTYRLPKASYTYDARHGWFTEWPRIREIDRGRLLMTMHGMFWQFPKRFRARSTAGIRPLSSYLKIVADFCEWDGRVVFACDDAAKLGNPLCGQSQSNLWFVPPDRLRTLGLRSGFGGVWLNDEVKAGEPSDAFVFGGFDRRMVHLWHDADAPVTLTLEIDKGGTNTWSAYKSIKVPAKAYTYHVFPPDLHAEWIRITTDRDCRRAGAYFHYSTDRTPAAPSDEMFTRLPTARDSVPHSAGLIRPRGSDLGTLHFAAWTVDEQGRADEAGYYEIDADLKLEQVRDAKAHAWLKDHAAVKGPDFEVDEASVIVTDADGKRYRLPKGHPTFDKPTELGRPRGIREVVTERSLLNCHGTFYELPREHAGGLARIKPVCTHNRRIHDFCSWRGLLVISGVRADGRSDDHRVVSNDGKVSLWLGTIDDLWALGSPCGIGGPWKNISVRAGVPSDPYLMLGYDRKRLGLSHDATESVEFRVQVDVDGSGRWFDYATLAVAPGRTRTHEFPRAYSVHWVRLVAERDVTATATFTYEGWTSRDR